MIRGEREGRREGRKEEDSKKEERSAAVVGLRTDIY